MHLLAKVRPIVEPRRDSGAGGSDFAMLLGSININSGETFSAQSLLPAVHNATAKNALSSIPEPAALSPLLLAALALTRRRRAFPPTHGKYRR